MKDKRLSGREEMLTDSPFCLNEKSGKQRPRMKINYAITANCLLKILFFNVNESNCNEDVLLTIYFVMLAAQHSAFL